MDILLQKLKLIVVFSIIIDRLFQLIQLYFNHKHQSVSLVSVSYSKYVNTQSVLLMYTD